jgi:hypothetical protein
VQRLYKNFYQIFITFKPDLPASIRKVLDFLALTANFGHCLNANLQVQFYKVLGNFFVGLFRFYAFGEHGRIGDQQ